MPTDETDMAVLDWRQQQLEAAGYGFYQALQLAARADVDLHQATELLAAGCNPDLAIDILT